MGQVMTVDGRSIAGQRRPRHGERQSLDRDPLWVNCVEEVPRTGFRAQYTPERQPEYHVISKFLSFRFQSVLPFDR